MNNECVDEECMSDGPFTIIDLYFDDGEVGFCSQHLKDAIIIGMVVESSTGYELTVMGERTYGEASTEAG